MQVKNTTAIKSMCVVGAAKDPLVNKDINLAVLQSKNNCFSEPSVYICFLVHFLTCCLAEGGKGEEMLLHLLPFE